MDDTIELEVLSVGQGDLKLTFDKDDMGEARRVIAKMLADGFAIFVETDRGLRRVKRFNPKRLSYVVSDAPEEQAVPPKRGGSKERNVPAAGSRAKAIAATAGG